MPRRRAHRAQGYFSPLDAARKAPIAFRFSSPRPRNAGIDLVAELGGLLDVADEVVGPCPLGADLGEVGRARVRDARAEVCMAVLTAGLREQLRARERLLVRRSPAFSAHSGTLATFSAAERFLGGRALVGEHAHRDHGQDRGDERDRPAQRSGARGGGR